MNIEHLDAILQQLPEPSQARFHMLGHYDYKALLSQMRNRYEFPLEICESPLLLTRNPAKKSILEAYHIELLFNYSINNYPCLSLRDISWNEKDTLRSLIVTPYEVKLMRYAGQDPPFLAGLQETMRKVPVPFIIEQNHKIVLSAPLLQQSVAAH